MQSEAGTLVAEGGLVSEAQLQQALRTGIELGGTLVQNLVRLGFVSDTDLATFFSSRLQIPMAEQAQFENLPAFITRLVPVDMVMSHRTVPIMLHQGVLHMAISDPSNRSALEEISFITGYSAVPVAASDTLVEAAMARYYGIPPDDKLPPEAMLVTEPADRAPSLTNVPPAGNPGVNELASGPFARGPATQPPPPEQEDQLARQVEAEPSQAEPVPVSRSDTNMVVVEPASGELEELFGMGNDGEEIIHLVQPKGASTATSITDAIRIQVAKETGQPLDEVVEPQAPETMLSTLSQSDTEYLIANPDMASERPFEAEPEAPVPDEPEPVAPELAAAAPVATEPEAQPTPAEAVQIDSAAPPPQQEADQRPADPIWSSDQNANSSAAAVGETPGALAPLHNAEEARYLIGEAKDRDAVAKTLVRYSLASMRRAVLFIIKKDMLVGWTGGGQDISSNQVKGIMIPLGSPSVFRTVRETGTDYFGTLPRTTVNDIFLAALGDIRPRQVLLIPVSVRHKPICILYGDCATDAGFDHDLSGIHLIAQDASAAFEAIILERKMNRLVNR